MTSGLPPIPSPAPRLTIITPSYNHAPYLRRCIDSVLDQGYPNLQYLVLDGGSTDGTPSLLRSYGDTITWRSEPDGGQAAAINDGLRMADGDIVAWLNSDDYYALGAFARAVAMFADDSTVDMIYGRGHMVDANERLLREFPTFNPQRLDMRRTCSICQPTVFLRRRVIADVGLLNPALDICFDYDWWLRIMREHVFRFCPHVLAVSRHYGTTKTDARRLRALVEAGYVLRYHHGRTKWRWSGKWLEHRWSLRRSRFLLPPVGWISAARSAARFRRRFDARRTASPHTARILARLATPPALEPARVEVDRAAAAALLKPKQTPAATGLPRS